MNLTPLLELLADEFHHQSKGASTYIGCRKEEKAPKCEPPGATTCFTEQVRAHHCIHGIPEGDARVRATSPFKLEGHAD